MALSNFMCLYPIIEAWNNDDLITFVLTLNVGLASFFSHLFECHKHGMTGMGLSKRTSYILNRWDVISAILILLRVVQLILDNLEIIELEEFRVCVGWAVILLVINLISEHDHSIKTRSTYIITHSIWHLGVFYLLGSFLVLVDEYPYLESKPVPYTLY
jgi:hypothetical protein